VSVTPLDLVSAHPWQRVAFTTYALSLSFVEAVILDALVRGGGGSQPLILADVQGVRASLSEQGAHRVGKDYEVEPVAVSNGVFHPKISVFSSPDECHVLVGSGNLTFGGWGGNWEILEHLHPSFAADAIADAADFFELLPASDRIRQGAAEHCVAIAADLRRSIQGRPSNGGIRLFHNLDASISEQVAQTVTDLGGAVRLVAAAPFWDDGAAIDRLCRAIGLPELFVHAHTHGCIEGIGGANWPRRARTPVRAVRVAVMDTAEKPGRRLHAKAFEILCRRGRVLVSGSANGTAAALGPNRNIEACVVRIQRERSVGWTIVDAEPPDPQAEPEDTTDSGEASSGVLRATLEGDEVTGQVLTPKMSGPVSVYHLSTMGPELLGNTMLGPDEVFRITAPDLEKWSWRGARLVIRVQQADGRQSEGFVSVASFADITRRTGTFGRRLFALLAGNETPADVAAILSWFHEDPHRLAADEPNAVRGGSVNGTRADSDQLISVATLSGQYAEALTASSVPHASSHRNWSRFMDQILLAFRDPRGPFGRTGAGRAGEDEEDEAQDDPTKAPAEDPAIDKSLSLFERLFVVLTRDGGPARDALIAFDLTQYVCGRLRPDAAQAREWLDQLIRALLNAGVPPERRQDVAAAVLTVLGASPQAGLWRWARGCLLRLGLDFGGEPPLAEGVRGFQALLPPQATFPELWMRLRGVRTYPEQVRAYLQALAEGKPSTGYPDLPGDAREEWPVLEDALISPQSRDKLLIAYGSLEACPHHHIRLPSVEISKLRSKGIATTHCCRKIVILKGA
jgi:hypothetical protein